MLSKYCARNLSVIKNVKKCFKRKRTYISSSNIVTSGHPDMEIPNVTVPEFFVPYHQKFEKFTAAECFETKRKYTYGEVRKKSTNLGKALRKILKLGNGDVVGILLTNVPEYSIASLGILKANLTVTTFSTAFTPDEISRQLIDANVKAIITEVDLTSTVQKAINITSKNLPLLTVKTTKDQALPENTIDFHEFVNVEVDYPDLPPCSPENVACLPYSSGTTGLPKGVQITHRNLVANMIQNNHPELGFAIEATEDFQEELPTVLPMNHMFGYSIVMTGTTVFGGKVITLPKYRLDAYISLLKENPKNSILYVVPPIVLSLIGQESVKKEYCKNVRIVFSAAAPLAASDEKRFCQKFGDHMHILQGYGLSETSPIVTALYPKLLEKEKTYRGSIGRPVPNTQLKIVDIDDPNYTPLGPNVNGELLIKGPQVMKGYLNLPEETKNILTADGWLKTGDVCHYNEDGFVFITDRLKELIKVNANQVPPAELEAVVRSFPGVLDAAVIGVPHKTSGEVPRAYVVAKSREKMDIKKLDEFVSERVARYKQLKGGIVMVDEILKSPTGKILRRKIKEEFLKNGI